MKRLMTLTAFAALVLATTSADKNTDKSNGYPYQPVPFTSVKVTDSFWGQRLKASREVTIPLAFSKCEEAGRYTNFVNAARHMANPADTFTVSGYSFDDTDVYKTIEGASYILQTYPDAKLEAYCDSVIDIVASAQEPDGYLYTARTQNPEHPHEWAGAERWELVEDLSHEFYNLGHMIEGAVAYYQATGKDKFLNVARRFADCVIREVGPDAGQVVRVPGHEIAEMALSRLYLATGEQKYLDMAKFFVDYRGRTDHHDEYNQTHAPISEQDEAVGHAVRAAYFYAGVADVAALTGEQEYIDDIDRIWENIVSKKLYITGGIGATSSGEAFGRNYELPNMSAYCETCAAIGNVYVNYRMFALHGDAKYYDVLERSLYNGLISGVSLSGDGFFYPNPLESIGQHHRQPWFGCACCPSNICRFIPSVPGYVYAVKDDNLYVNLYMSNTMTHNVGGKSVTIRQETGYPWNGDVKVTIEQSKAKTFSLKLRIPGWVRGQVVPSDLYSYDDGKKLGYSVKVNGQEVSSDIEKGYFTITRSWKKGDEVELHLDMEPRVVKANGMVKADQGRISIERGPIVYCAEWPDNEGFSVRSVIMNQNPTFEVESEPDVLCGIETIKTAAQTLSYGEDGRVVAKDVELTLIPYYAWCQRGSGEMTVWLPRDISSTNPTMPATLASRSKVEASQSSRALSAVNDRLVPKGQGDASPYFDWWPAFGGTQWITYMFPEESTVSRSSVYFFDDQPWGGCKVPTAWRVYYLDNDGNWAEVSNPDHYGTSKGMTNEVNFDSVKTLGMKIELDQPEGYSCGLYEWEVK